MRLNFFACEEKLGDGFIVDALLCRLGIFATLARIKLDDDLRDLCNGATLVVLKSSFAKHLRP